MTNSYIFASGAAMPCARWVFSPCGRQAERGYFHRGTSATGEGLEPTAPCRARGRRSRGRERPAGGGRRRRRCGGEELGRLAPARARLTRVASMAQALKQVARTKFELVMTDLD